MSRIAFFIDGFNLFHALDFCSSAQQHHQYHKYKWLNLNKLAECFVTKQDTIASVNYFTTLVTWNRSKFDKHKLYIKAQEAEGVNVIYGEFKRKDKKCPKCHQKFSTFEEKQTDVNIALSLFQKAVLDEYDTAIIVSGDTDLIPSVKMVKKTFPNKRIGVVIPIGRASEDFKNNTDFHYKMKEKHLISSRFPNQIVLPNSVTLDCPSTWL
jgi:uncharacterized LabA/DUF88 family protein